MNNESILSDLKHGVNPVQYTSGMTLLEVLLAMLMLATIVSMVSLSLSGSFAVVESTRDQGELYYRAQVAFQRISEDISSAVLIDDIEFIGTREELGPGRADTLSFASTAHVVFDEQNDNTGMAVLSYTVKDDPENEQELVLLRSDTLLTPSNSEEKTVVPDDGGFLLCDRLRSVTFSYFDETGEELDSWSTEVDEASKDEERRLPVSVGCTLEFWVNHDEERTLEFSTRILLPVGLINAKADS